MRTAEEKKAILQKKLSTNIQDIKERAQQKKTKKPSDKINIRHVATKRRTQARFEGLTNYQIESDLLSFKHELNKEKQYIYLCEKGQKMLQTTGITAKETMDTHLKYQTYTQSHNL